MKISPHYSLVRALQIWVFGLFVTAEADESPWNGWGGNTNNNRWASSNSQISSSNINSTSVHCQIAFPGGVSATPTILEDTAYFPVWNGSFIALDYTTCKVKWNINVTQIVVDFAPPTSDQSSLESLNVLTATSRTSPTIDSSNQILYFGTTLHALIVAIDLNTGNVLNKTQVHSHPFAHVTNSGTLYDGILYTGVSSVEENAQTAGLPCCSFIGVALALKFDRSTNQFTALWEVPTLPPPDPKQNGSWTGVGVWGSSPSIDTTRNQVFFATGNVYTVPELFLPCTASSNKTCFPDNVLQESVLAIDLYSGKVNWVQRLSSLDAWTGACDNSQFKPLCPETPGPDADFGMAPTFIPGGGVSGTDVLAIGQKRGYLWSLAADTGVVEWSTVVGPGSEHGGMSWGIAADEQQVYFTEINAGGASWVPQPKDDTAITNAAFGAALLTSGALIWETPAPLNLGSTVPPTVVGDLVLTGAANDSTNPLAHHLLALTKATGDIIFNMTLDTYSQGGIAVYNNFIFLGTGYHADGSFYVFTVDA